MAHQLLMSHGVPYDRNQTGLTGGCAYALGNSTLCRPSHQKSEDTNKLSPFMTICV